jgi:hypothetical protein
MMDRDLAGLDVDRDFGVSAITATPERVCH